VTWGYRSWFQDLINVWTMPATILKNKVMYRQFIHSIAFVNSKCFTCLRPLHLYFLDTPLTSHSWYNHNTRHTIVQINHNTVTQPTGNMHIKNLHHCHEC
jgi:hypothetical protein